MDPRVGEPAQALDAYSAASLPPIHTRFDTGGIARGHAVQQAEVSPSVSHWIEQGRRPVGRKIGLTSPAVRKQLGVAEPDFAGSGEIGVQLVQFVRRAGKRFEYESFVRGCSES